MSSFFFFHSFIFSLLLLSFFFYCCFFLLLRFARRQRCSCPYFGFSTDFRTHVTQKRRDTKRAVNNDIVFFLKDLNIEQPEFTSEHAGKKKEGEKENMEAPFGWQHTAPSTWELNVAWGELLRSSVRQQLPSFFFFSFSLLFCARVSR